MENHDERIAQLKREIKMIRARILKKIEARWNTPSCLGFEDIVENQKLLCLNQEMLRDMILNFAELNQEMLRDMRLNFAELATKGENTKMAGENEAKQ